MSLQFQYGTDSVEDSCRAAGHQELKSCGDGKPQQQTKMELTAGVKEGILRAKLPASAL